MPSRDFLAIPKGDTTIVVTCDSIGGIGNQELDVVCAEPAVVGRFLARVALMELYATGASLTALSCTLSVTPHVADLILQGVYQESAILHRSPESVTIVSTEKNVPTRQTGVGITCIGLATNKSWRVGIAQAGDLVVALGHPKVGDEVALDDHENADLTKLKWLLGTKGIKDISPAGSKGVLYEAKAIASSANLHLSLAPGCTYDYHKSAGPATALVFACNEAAYREALATIRPLTCIGRLEKMA
ncbi:MAG: hypothetical protein KGZ66_10095 [Selenomonadales bacterium]|nr:hypothetical protein [Selenomonadales bacterium]